MNELSRRMARCGLSRFTVGRGLSTTGYRSSSSSSSSGIITTKQQPCRLVLSSSSTNLLSRSISTTRTLSSVVTPQRVHFSSTKGKDNNNPQNLESTIIEDNESKEIIDNNILSPPTTTTSGKVITDPSSGEQFGMILDTRKLPKLKPSIVQRRLSKCKTYVGQEKSIRQSPWKLNRICQLASGLTLEEALTQLKFCSLKNADLVAKVLKRTSNLADIRDGIQMSQLEVAECFATKSMMLRRIKPMGRGRYVVVFVSFFFLAFALSKVSS